MEITLNLNLNVNVSLSPATIEVAKTAFVSAIMPLFDDLKALVVENGKAIAGVREAIDSDEAADDAVVAERDQAKKDLADAITEQERLKQQLEQAAANGLTADQVAELTAALKAQGEEIEVLKGQLHEPGATANPPAPETPPAE